MTSFGIISLTAFFGPIAVGLVVFGIAVRAGYRIWPIWLTGLIVILVAAWPEGSWLGIPWAALISEAGHGSDAAELGLAIFFLFLWTVIGWIAWSFAALLGNDFKQTPQPEA
jgi:hypothetical protein